MNFPFCKFLYVFHCFSWMKCMSISLSHLASLTELIFFNLGKFAISRYFEARNLINSKKIATRSFFDENGWNFEETCILPSCLGIPICSQIGKHFIKTNFSKTVYKIISVKAFWIYRSLKLCLAANKLFST